MVLSQDQNEVVEFLLQNQYSFNCSQTGFGKTITTLTAAVHNAVNNPTLDIHYAIVVPNSAVKAFEYHLKDILGIPYSIYTATKTRVTSGARFHIFNYTTLSKDAFKTQKKQVRGKWVSQKELVSISPQLRALLELRKEHNNLWLIADEAHGLQDANSNQYKIMAQLRNIFLGVWFLTATPILNNIDGLFYMVDLVRPGFFNNIYAFRNRYTVQEEIEFWEYSRTAKKPVLQKRKVVVGYKNQDVLKQKFAEIAIIKSREYDLTFHYKSVDINPEFQKYYKMAGDGIFKGGKDASKGSKQDHAAARLHDLQRVVSNSHKDLKYSNDYTKLTTKEELLLKTIVEVLGRDEATLIYFSYTETLERVKGLLELYSSQLGINKIHIISGEVKLAVRKKVADILTNRDVVLMTSAGTESIDLQQANNLIFYEVPFPIREFIQACGRIARFNTKYSEFNVYVLEMSGTIDEYKKNRIIANTPLIKSVLGSSSTLPTELLDIGLDDIKEMRNELLWWK